MATLLIIGLLLLSGTIIARYGLSFQGFSAFLLAPTIVYLFIVIPGTLIYVPWQIPTWLGKTLCFTPILAAIPLVFRNISALRPSLPLPTRPFRFGAVLAIIIHLTIITACFAVLWAHQTTDSLVGPWETIPAYFFILLCASFVTLHFVIKQSLPQWCQLATLSLQYLVVASVTAIIFPLAYGFDPQIHLATAGIISEQGYASPKQPYYLGYYVLLSSLSQGLCLSLATINQWVVPIIVSTLLPTLTYLALFKKFQRDSLALTGALIFLIVPVFPFASLTPWGLATALALGAIIATIHSRSILFPIALTIAASLVHPIPGLIAVGYLCFYKLYSLKIKHAPIILCLALIVSLPLTFLIADIALPQISISLGWFGVTDLLAALWEDIVPTRYRAALDVTYFMRTIITAIIGIAMIVLMKDFFVSLKESRTTEDTENIAGYFGICLMISGMLCYLFLRFSNLAANEQSDYSLRVITFGLLCVLPWIALKLTPLVWRDITASHLSLRLFILLLLAGAGTAATYHGYPHRDAYIAYHGYSISHADIEAVRLVHEHGATTRFVVLANQMVSAAAIRTYGFPTYFTSETDGKTFFYYPTPADSPLRPYYEAVLRHPQRETITALLNQVAIDRIYLVIPSYERNYRAFTSDPKLYDADGFFTTSDGAVKVYWFDRAR